MGNKKKHVMKPILSKRRMWAADNIRALRRHILFSRILGVARKRTIKKPHFTLEEAADIIQQT